MIVQAVLTVAGLWLFCWLMAKAIKAGKNDDNNDPTNGTGCGYAA